jgi:perosamine synthetase
MFEICASLRNQGRARAQEGYEYPFIRLGYNYRLSEVSCALGISQLDRINEIIEKRRIVAEHYNLLLQNVEDIELPLVPGDVKLSWFVYVIRLGQQFERKDRDNIIKELTKQGIGCGTYFQAIHLQPLYQNMFSFKQGDFPITEHISDRTIALPFYNNLTKQEIELIVEKLQKSIKDLR